MQDGKIYKICNTAHSAIAGELYHFLANQNALPQYELVRDMADENENDQDHLGHALNNLFIDKAIEVLLSGVPDGCLDKARSLLQVTKNLGNQSAIKDSFEIRFLALEYTHPYFDDLKLLQSIISTFDYKALIEGETKLTTIKLALPSNEIQELMILAEYYCGVYVTCNDLIGRASASLIIEIGALRKLAMTSDENSLALEAYRNILKIVGKYCSNALYLFSKEPELLIIYPSPSQR